MNIVEAIRTTKRLLKEHGFDVPIVLTNTKVTIAQARFANGKPYKLALSKHFIALNGERELIETVKHEIAHFFTGIEAGHGPEWRSWARRLGCTPLATTSKAKMPEPSIRIECGCCNKVVGRRHRKPSKSFLNTNYCKRCGPRSLGNLRVIEC